MPLTHRVYHNAGVCIKTTIGQNNIWSFSLSRHKIWTQPLKWNHRHQIPYTIPEYLPIINFIIVYPSIHLSRLIVVANREMVNTCFSAPLLGRFEKHFLAASSLLTSNQKFVVDRLKSWVLQFAATVHGGRRWVVFDEYHCWSFNSIL